MSSELEDNTAKFLKVREAIKVLETRHAQELKPYLEYKDKLEGWLGNFLEMTGQKTAVTKQGTVHWRTKPTATVKDPQEFMNYVKSNSTFDLLERRANVTAVKEFIERTGATPPGVSLNIYRSIGVRKPGEKE